MATLSDRNTPFNPLTGDFYARRITIPSYGAEVPSTHKNVYTKEHTGLSATNILDGIPISYAYNKPVPVPVPVPVDGNITGIDAVLAQRGNRYGKFTGHAKIAQDLKAIMQATSNWKILTSDQKESLEMIMHKVGRILNGDPNYDDSWIDIGGYSKLVADRLTSGKEV